MNKIKIVDLRRFDSFKDVQDFVRDANKTDNNISVIANKYIVNAKSILGMMSIFYEDNFKLEISYKNENEVENILKSLEGWVK